MDSLNTIPNSGSFGDVSAKLNDNFSKVGQSLTTLENVAIANKGYFDTLASLQAAFPSPKAGNIAYVANVASSTGYYIYNVVSGVWTATTAEAPPIEVNINLFEDDINLIKNNINYINIEDISSRVEVLENSILNSAGVVASNAAYRILKYPVNEYDKIQYIGDSGADSTDEGNPFPVIAIMYLDLSFNSFITYTNIPTNNIRTVEAIAPHDGFIYINSRKSYIPNYTVNIFRKQDNKRYITPYDINDETSKYGVLSADYLPVLKSDEVEVIPDILPNKVLSPSSQGIIDSNQYDIWILRVNSMDRIRFVGDAGALTTSVDNPTPVIFKFDNLGNIIAIAYTTIPAGNIREINATITESCTIYINVRIEFNITSNLYISKRRTISIEDIDNEDSLTGVASAGSISRSASITVGGINFKLNMIGTIWDAVRAELSSIYFPMIINTEKIVNPIGKYYMYYSKDHASTDGSIGMAYSDDLINWTKSSLNMTALTQIGVNAECETPWVIWDEPSAKLRMYWHSNVDLLFSGADAHVQTTYISESSDGINFTYIKPMFEESSKFYAGDGHTGYMSMIQWQGRYIASHLNGGTDQSWVGLSYSYDGLNFYHDPMQWSAQRNGLFNPNLYVGELPSRNVFTVNGRLFNIGRGGAESSGTTPADFAIYISEIASDLKTRLGYGMKIMEMGAIASNNIRSTSIFQDNDGLVYFLCNVDNKIILYKLYINK